MIKKFKTMLNKEKNTDIKSFLREKKKNYINKKKPKGESYPYSIHDPYLVTNEPSNYRDFFLVGDNWLTKAPLDTVVVIGCNDWKFGFISDYLKEYKVAFLPRKKVGITAFNAIRRLGKKPKAILIWGYTDSTNLRKLLKLSNYETWRIEDGFIRSSSLGATHSTPYSLVIDKNGLYFNYESNSDLTTLLSEYELSLVPDLEEKAKHCLSIIERFSLSKYNPPVSNKENDLKIKKRIAVLGQVDNDAAIKFGNPDGWTSKSLVELAYYENPDCEILYRPHPEVYKGYQKSKLRSKSIEKIAKISSPEENIISFIDKCDHIYTITSLTGLEALIRGKKVTIVGTPFYAGWGPTDDRVSIKRNRKLSVNEIFYISYIIYPQYFREENKYLGFLGAAYNIIVDREIISKDATKELKNDIKLEPPKALPLRLLAQKIEIQHINESNIRSLFSIYDNHYFHYIFSCYLLGRLVDSSAEIDKTLTLLKACLTSDLFLKTLTTFHKVNIEKELDSTRRTELNFIYYKHGLSYLSKAIDHASTIKLVRENISSSETNKAINTTSKQEQSDTKEDTNPEPCTKLDIKNLAKPLTHEAIVHSIKSGNYDDAISLVSESLISGVSNEAYFELTAKLLNEKMDYNAAEIFYKFICDTRLSNKKIASFTYESIRTSIYSNKIKDFNEIFLKIVELIKLSPEKYLSSIKLLQLAMSKYGISERDSVLFNNTLKFTFNNLPESIDLVSSLLDLKQYQKARNALISLNEKNTNSKKVAIFLSYYYSLIGDINNAESVLENYINGIYSDPYLVREYLRVLRISGKFREGLSVIEMANNNGVDINPVLKIPFLQGIGEIEKAYKIYTLIPFRDKLIEHFGGKYLTEHSNINISGNILILAGWGPGDEIRFSSLYPQFNKHFKNANVTFSCDYRLHELLHNTYPDLHFIPTHRTRDFDFDKNKVEIFSGIQSSDFSILYDSNLYKKLNQYDHILLATDLVHMYIERKEKWLSTVKYKTKENKKSIKKEKNKLYIGLNWRSSLDDKSRDIHYFDLKEFSPLLEDEEIQIISLQYDSLTSEERHWLEVNHPNSITELSDIDQYNDLSSVSELINQLDCVIAPCTTVSELSGALGKKTFFISNSAEIKWRVQENDNDIWFSGIEHVYPQTPIRKDETLNKLFEKIKHFKESYLSVKSNQTWHEESNYHTNKTRENHA
ncbi:hypothetical protein LL240_09090 [Oceanimonas baumannii]|uniref:capsular polysaccharide export protein, LipB/KpsS family n=1 Tax=Oceanimonas baumannii TaxID=129578 RepID=UPI001D1939B3|nr:hypothetical protein [Oceanimonas baumannii]MCC4264613.1 hypothetical protein [Oceanimonas baumannii]